VTKCGLQRHPGVFGHTPKAHKQGYHSKSFQTSENTLKLMKTFQKQDKWLDHNTLGKQENENN